MKPVFQMCLMVLVLLMQTVPLVVMAGPQEEKCQMACCMAQAALSDCSCVDEPSAPEKNLPAPLLPAAEGRGFIPQVVWTELPQDFRSFAFQARQTGGTIRPHADERASTSSRHVRLSVLFCSMLT